MKAYTDYFSSLINRKIPSKSAFSSEMTFSEVFSSIDSKSRVISEDRIFVNRLADFRILDTFLPFGASPLDAIYSVDWMTYGPFDLSAAAGSTVYLEFHYAGAATNFIGLYIDDVSVAEVIPAP